MDQPLTVSSSLQIHVLKIILAWSDISVQNLEGKAKNREVTQVIGVSD